MLPSSHDYEEYRKETERLSGRCNQINIEISMNWTIFTNQLKELRLLLSEIPVSCGDNKNLLCGNDDCHCVLYALADERLVKAISYSEDIECRNVLRNFHIKRAVNSIQRWIEKATERNYF